MLVGPGRSATTYAIHLPSGENRASIGKTDRTSPKGADWPVFTASDHNAKPEGRSTLYRSVSLVGDHDSGRWDVPFSARVRRSARPAPSAFCQNMARSPSRSD